MKSHQDLHIYIVKEAIVPNMGKLWADIVKAFKESGERCGLWVTRRGNDEALITITDLETMKKRCPGNKLWTKPVGLTTLVVIGHYGGTSVQATTLDLKPAPNETVQSMLASGELEECNGSAIKTVFTP